MITHPSLRRRIVLPFVVLVLFVGVVGTAVVSAQVGGSSAAAFDNTLIRQSLLANDRLTSLENDRLQQLRAAADTAGVEEAVAQGDATATSRLISPIIGNAQPEHLTIRMLAAGGQQLVALQRVGSAVTTVTDGISYASVPAVIKALRGERDTLGNKYVFLANEASTPVLYWTAPVQTESGAVAGAALLGESLSEIAAAIHDSKASEVAFYASSGQVLTATMDGMPLLSADIMRQVSHDTPVRIAAERSDHPYRLLVSDWTMRDTTLGYLAVAMPADDLDAAVTGIRLVLVIVFGAFALATLLIGIALADRITRPIDELVTSMQSVSGGDYSPRIQVRSADEIGYLARTFNEMTSALQAHIRERDEAYFRNLEALARAIDARDPYTFEHSARVAAISEELAESMDMPSTDLITLRRSGLLHDVGKIGIPDHILSKTSPLTDDEWASIRRHPVIGYDMLKDVPFLQPSLDAIRHHHERWDGEGYPDRLKGQAISQMARIVTVADAFDAMTSDRPYRSGFSFAFAADTIVSEAGRQFDPAVVKVFTARKHAIFALLQEMGKRPTPHASDIHLEEAA